MRYKLGVSRSELNLGPIEDLIAPDHYIRLLDEFVDKAVLVQEADYTSKGSHCVGQRPYGARSLLKLYVYGYLNRITSSRRLEAEAGRNIELIWLLQNLQPDFKTIADYRKDHGDAIRLLLGQFNSFLKAESYIAGESVSIDSVRLKANTDRQAFSLQKIQGRLKRLESQLNKYLTDLDLQDEGELKLEELTELDLRKQKSIDKIAQLESEIADLVKKKTGSRRMINAIASVSLMPKRS